MSSVFFDVVIVGGGVTAAALASLLVERKVSEAGRLAIVGAGAPPAATADWDLRVFALSRASQRVLLRGGAWPLLPQDRIFAYERMCVWEAAGEPYGRGSVSFDCAALGEPDLGAIVEGRALADASRRAAAAAGVLFIDATVASLETSAAHVLLRLSDGRALRCGLLVAADGSDSPVRSLLGIETAGHAYHQDAFVAHVRTAKPHRSTAWQRFLPSGPLAFLPLPDGRSSIVWSVGRDEAAHLRALDPAAFGTALEAASAGVLGACELTTAVAAFPLRLQYATDYVRPRAVLVGDAAHAVHPLAGQGLNLGLLDCAALAEVLAEAGAARHADPRVLRRYERWRRSENLLASAALDGLERLFASENLAVSGLRSAGLAAVERLPFVKLAFAARALGLRGDLPRFLGR